MDFLFPCVAGRYGARFPHRIQEQSDGPATDRFVLFGFEELEKFFVVEQFAGLQGPEGSKLFGHFESSLLGTEVLGCIDGHVYEGPGVLDGACKSIQGVVFEKLLGEPDVRMRDDRDDVLARNGRLLCAIGSVQTTECFQ